MKKLIHEKSEAWENQGSIFARAEYTKKNNMLLEMVKIS